MSHILVWTKSPTQTISAGIPQQVSVGLIELPRLQLSFYARVDPATNTTRFYSSEYVGMFISNVRSESVNGFLNGLPHAIVVENADAELAIVTPALGPILVPFKDVNGQERPPQLLFNRPQASSSKANAATSASVSHYIYPIHLSKTFLCTPTIESAIYLLLNRMIHKQYPDAFQLAESCVSDVSWEFMLRYIRMKLI